MTGLITDNPHEEPAPTGPRPAASGRLPGAAILALLLLILAVAVWFRFDGITWDGGTHLHPDERFLTIVGSKLSVPDNPLDYLRTSRSTLNPYNFGEGFYVYGNFPMTVTRFAAEWSAGLCDAVAARAGQPWCAYAFTGYDGIHLVGRFLSALVDLISIVFTFLIGRRLYGQWAGLIAAALLALAVMPIQQSHFFTMDNWAAAFTTAAIYFAVRAASLGDAEPRWRLHWWALFGLALGLAVSARINMAPLALVINISAIIWLARRKQWLDFQEPARSGRWYDFARNDIWRALTGIALAAVVSVLTFRLAQPYAFMDAAMVRETAAAAGQQPNALVVALKSVIGLNPQFLANMAEIQRLQAPEALFPPALQWVARPAILFPLSNMILYGTGLTAGLFAWFAVLWALWRVFSGRRSPVEVKRQAGSLSYGQQAGSLSYAQQAGSLSHGQQAGSLSYAQQAGSLSYGQQAGSLSYAQQAGSLSYAQQAGSLSHAQQAGSLSYGQQAGSLSYGSLATPEWMLHAIPVFWTLSYFLYMGTRWVKSIRYFLPIYPTLFILAGWALVYLWRRAAAGKPNRSALARPAMVALAALIVLPSLLWAVAFTRIYREPLTRVAASQWMFEHVPSGATLIYETAAGETRELQLPLRAMLFEHQGVPLFLDFTMPEDGVIRAVRFNYLSDPDFDGGAQAAEDGESIRVSVNEGPPTELALDLGAGSQAVQLTLPPTAVSAGPVRLTAEAGAGGPIRAETSVILNEHWDDALPVGLDGRNPYGSYYSGGIEGPKPVTHPDSPEKREQVLGWLAEADFIAITSQRAMWHLPRLPLTYPLMIEYYESLFNGELGFELVAQFHENTRIGPLYLSDTSGQISWGEPPEIGWPPPNELAAEEAFSVYDHPPVWIFRKTESYDPAQARALLESVDLGNVIAMNPLEATQARNGLRLSAREQAIQQAGGTYTEVFDVDGVLSQNPWLAAVAFVVAQTLLGLVAFPIAYTALRGLPDRGYALSRVLALLLISYLPWLAASLKLLPFTRGAIVIALLAVLALSAWLFLRREAEIVAFFREHWRTVLLIEGLGLALFALMIAIRLGNPDVWDVIWGGEKPMDLSYFTAVMRSTTFPPYDPWNAGGYINYYYYGFVFAGAITKLLGVVPTVAYNLVLPLLFSMTGLAVFSLAWNLVVAAQRTGQEGTGFLKTRPPARTAAAAGLVAIVLALLLGNLAQMSVIGNAWYLSGTAELEQMPLIGRAARTLDGGIKVLSGRPAPIYPGDWFWLASRAINANPGEVQPITEFPYFTFLYADLHAHMLSMPLTMLALGWAISLALLAGRKRTGEGAGRLESLILWLVGALAIGVLRPTNTWDWPTYLLLGSVAAAWYFIRREDGINVRSLAKSLMAAAALFGLSTLFFWPFIADFGSAYSSVSLWPGSYTRAWNYLLVYGLFLFIVVTHIYREFRDWTQSWTEEGKRRLEPYLWPILSAAFLLLVVTAFLISRGYRVAPLALPLLLAAGLLALRPGLAAARRVVLALIAASLGLTLLVEIIVLDGDVGRMNTVFKFYLQVWLLLSVACGPAVVWAWSSVRRMPRLKSVWRFALGLLVFVALLYPLTATAAHWNIRMNREAPRTLDGAEFLRYVEYGDANYLGEGVIIRPGDDLGAIDWLRRNVQGSPVIMEAYGGNPYRSIAARIAMYTGLPSVIGWDWHQRQQRAVVPGAQVSARIDDVNNFYNTPDPATAAAILDKYGVQYVVVGSLENAYYWPQGLAKFDRMAAEGALQEVYRDATARIYRVADPEAAGP